MVKILRITVAIMIYILLPIVKASGQDISSYLILEDINGFRASKNPSTGQGPGVLVAAGHFYHDHKDMTYRISYFNLQTRVGPDVQVTQHAGVESDKWLLHEVDRSFRNYFGLPGDSYVIRIINGNPIMAAGSGGWTYRWLSGNKVIHIEYTDLQMEKPEPIEVVRAYIDKNPSSLPLMTSTDLRTRDNKTVWIKDEMERRLWLCEKWFLHLQMGKVTLDEALDAVVKSMGVFLDYREKYYGIRSKDEKLTLLTYLNQKDGTSIKQRLSTYKIWWAINKGKSINVP